MYLPPSGGFWNSSFFLSHNLETVAPTNTTESNEINSNSHLFLILIRGSWSNGYTRRTLIVPRVNKQQLNTDHSTMSDIHNMTTWMNEESADPCWNVPSKCMWHIFIFNATIHISIINDLGSPHNVVASIFRGQNIINVLLIRCR